MVLKTVQLSYQSLPLIFATWYVVIPDLKQFQLRHIIWTDSQFVDLILAAPFCHTYSHANEDSKEQEGCDIRSCQYIDPMVEVFRS